MSVNNTYHNTRISLQAPKPEPKPEHHYASMDVMSILSRRLVMQSSDTSDSDSDSSDQDWDGDE